MSYLRELIYENKPLFMTYFTVSNKMKIVRPSERLILILTDHSS